MHSVISLIMNIDIAFLGNKGSGKTCMTFSYTKNKYLKNTSPTIIIDTLHELKRWLYYQRLN